VLAGFAALTHRVPDHFHMILSPDNPHYKDLPGLSVLIGGMWIANLSYWGFNQYIIQRALAAKSLGEAQKGVVFAAYLKLLMPVIIVLPGIAAVVLAPGLAKPDEAYPTMMRLLPTGPARPGLLGTGRGDHRLDRVQDQFDRDHLHARSLRQVPRRSRPAARTTRARRGEEKHLVLVGRIVAALVAIVIALLAARPLLGGSDQAFQFIQEFTGFFTPGITVIFLLGLFWKRATECGRDLRGGRLGAALLRPQDGHAGPALHEPDGPRLPDLAGARGAGLAGARALRALNSEPPPPCCAWSPSPSRGGSKRR
jgi:SSS family solute:Na+ symporter